jgi:rhodanese-related sulfurtransferase
MESFFSDNIGFISSGFFNLSPREAYDEIIGNGAILVDLREPEYVAYKAFAIDETIFLPYQQLKDKYQDLPKDKPLILADSVGLNSQKAMNFLIEKNFKNIANLAGGFVEWERDGFPIKKDIKQQLSGSCMCQLKRRNKKMEQL